MYDTAIIIPHYNDVGRLVRCLEALMPQVGDDIEVVVADNGSTEPLLAVEARWPRVRIVHQPEKGAGLARNAGVKATTAPWLHFLDADCVPSPGWVAAGRRVRRPDVITGGPIELFDETSPPRSGAEAFEKVFAFRVDRYLEKDGFLVSAQLVLSRGTFDRVGGFMADLSEDTEWCRRAVSMGYRLALEPSLRVAHPTRSDWPSLERKWRRLTAEGFLLNGRRTTDRIRWTIKALMMPASVLAHAPRVLRSPHLTAGEKSRALGILALLRLRRMVWMIAQAAARPK